MSAAPFKIHIHVFKTNPDVFFQSAEQTVHAGTLVGGSWSVANEDNVLTGDTNGGSGCMRFISDSGESFIAAFGMDQEMPWCDIVPDLTPADTALEIHPQYYTQPDRIAAREARQTSYTVISSSGRSLAINFTNTGGDNLRADILIG